MKYLYFGIDLFVVVVPAIFSFHSSLKFYKHWRGFFITNSIVSILFIVWDIIFTKSGIWSFNPRYVSGLYIFQLPIEEILFFISIPFSCVFTFYCIHRFYVVRWKPAFETVFFVLLSLILGLVGVFFRSGIYTLIAFESTVLVIVFIKFIFRVEWMAQFMLAYCLLLFPFLIVNGILTGTGLDEPVVRYQNTQIIGARMFSIPVEDFVYGFELQLLNVFGFMKLYPKKF